MEHKGGISYYMQKFRFFATTILILTLITLPGRTVQAKITDSPNPDSVRTEAKIKEEANPIEALSQAMPKLPKEDAATADSVSTTSETPQGGGAELALPTAKTGAGAISELIPGGDAVAVRLTAQGVIVLGFTDEDRDNPGRTAGLKKGDRIVAIGDCTIDCNEAMTEALNQAGGNAVSLRYVRGNKEYETTVCPRQKETGGWQIGILIKDSTAGIGTLTFVIPKTGEYGCLGHGITDPDTDTLFCVGRGNLYPAEITNLRKGACGAPGELQGMFGSPVLGQCTKNCNTGLFGTLDIRHFEGRKTVPVASKSEVREGPATIRCTIDGTGMKEYSIEIVRIYRTFSGPTKNMLLRVTDPALLEQTGGIVQGMSGSPIFQNGKIVGAVTHVLINDPTSGYGIFIENMLDAA